VGLLKPAIARISVDLPAPVSPPTSRISPGWASSETSSMTGTMPYPAWRVLTSSTAASHDHVLHGRVRRHRVRRARGDDTPLLHDGDGVGDVPDQVEIVLDQDDRLAHAPRQELHQLGEIGALALRETGGRLVEE